MQYMGAYLGSPGVGACLLWNTFVAVISDYRIMGNFSRDPIFADKWLSTKIRPTK